MKSSKRGWVSSRRSTLVTQRTGVMQVLVDPDMLHQDQYAWYMTPSGPVRYESTPRPRRLRLAHSVMGCACVFRSGDVSDCRRDNLIACSGASDRAKGRRRRRTSQSRFKGLTRDAKGFWHVRAG